MTPKDQESQVIALPVLASGENPLPADNEALDLGFAGVTVASRDAGNEPPGVRQAFRKRQLPAPPNAANL